MTKHIAQDVQGADAKPNNNAFSINPLCIKVVPGLNPRTDFGNLDELKASIDSIGVREPMRVRKNADKEFELVNGERRLRAVRDLIDEGKEIKLVPVIVLSSKTSEIDSYIDTIVGNTGKPLTTVEEATAFKRLKAWGLSTKEIADSCGTSETTVRNRLSLADATPAVKKAVIDKEITAGQAREIVRDSGGKVDAEAHALLDKQTEPKPPRQKVTRIFIEAGEVRSKGGDCTPLATILSGAHLRSMILAAGYEPDSIKLSIAKIAE